MTSVHSSQDEADPGKRSVPLGLTLNLQLRAGSGLWEACPGEGLNPFFLPNWGSGFCHAW